MIGSPRTTLFKLTMYEPLARHCESLRQQIEHDQTVDLEQALSRNEYVYEQVVGTLPSNRQLFREQLLHLVRISST